MIQITTKPICIDVAYGHAFYKNIESNARIRCNKCGKLQENTQIIKTNVFNDTEEKKLLQSEQITKERLAIEKINKRWLKKYGIIID